MIHITDSQTDRILDDISEELFWNDKHYKSLKDNLETFDFTTFADKRFSEHLSKRNRIIIPDEDGQFVEFIIENTRKFHGVNGFSIEVYTSASYIELIKSKVISPQTTPAWTAYEHAELALSNTGWEIGTVHFAGVRTIHIEKHTNPFSYLKRIASEFELELHFRVEVDGNKVVRRYVDLLEHVGIWRGREVEFGKDLISIERKENMADIVTALVGLGPERQDGTRLEVFVEDKDALSRWGRDGQHLVEVYEPQSTDQDMTLERLTELTENELEKRVNSVVEYQAEIADLEKVPGLENEKIRFGYTIKIKDTAFNPPLYLEARVHTQERSIKKDGTKKVTLGDYIEHKEEDVLAIWRSLQSEIARKVSMSDVTDVVYTKPEVDDKDASVYQDGTIYTDSVSETKKQEAIQVAATDATNKANTAENNAKAHADNAAYQAEQNAKNYAEKKVSRGGTSPSNPVLYDLWIDESDSYIKQWTGSEWKPLAPTTAGDIGAYTKYEVDNALNTKVSVTQYNMDITGIVTDLQSQESRIIQNEQEIATKVSHQEYDIDINDLTSRMTSAESTIIQLADEIELRVEKNGIISAINQTAEQIKIQASKIQLQGAVTVLSDISGDLGTITAGIITGSTFLSEYINPSTGDLDSIYIRDGQLEINQSGGTGPDYIDGLLKEGRLNFKYYTNVGILAYEADFGFDGVSLTDYSFGNTIELDPLNARIRINGNNVWHAGNDGPGSGMDADTLDGLHANSFMRSNIDAETTGRITISNVGAGSGVREKALLTLKNYQPALDLHDLSGGANTQSIRFENDSNTLLLNLIDSSNFSINQELLRLNSTGMTVNGHLSIPGKQLYFSALSGLGNYDYINAEDSTNTFHFVFDGQQVGGIGNAILRCSSVNTGSSKEYKENLQDYTEEVLPTIVNVVPKTYFYKQGFGANGVLPHLGLIAEDLPPILLNAQKDAVDHYNLITFLWKGEQELYTKTEELTDEIEWLKLENQYLKQKIEQLEEKVA